MIYFEILSFIVDILIGVFIIICVNDIRYNLKLKSLIRLNKKIKYIKKLVKILSLFTFFSFIYLSMKKRNKRMNHNLISHEYSNINNNYSSDSENIIIGNEDEVINDILSIKRERLANIIIEAIEREVIRREIEGDNYLYD